MLHPDDRSREASPLYVFLMFLFIIIIKSCGDESNSLTSRDPDLAYDRLAPF